MICARTIIATRVYLKSGRMRMHRNIFSPWGCLSTVWCAALVELNFDKQIAEIDPLLWTAIRCMTRSKSEIRGISKVHDPTSQIYHIKKIRCFFLLCVIMFITDDRCSMPLHTLMTDIVESQGGSCVLVKTLNRLGVCSSADTLPVSYNIIDEVTVKKLT